MWLDSLKALFSEARKTVQQTSLENIGNHSDLMQAVINQDYSDELGVLETLLQEEHIDEVNAKLTSLCYARSLQNLDTVLDYFSNPLFECNKLYVDVIKALHPTATFAEIFQRLLPTITHEWVVKLDIVQGSRTKRARLERHLSLCEVAVGDEEGHLINLPSTYESFSQVVRVGHHVFVIDNIARFNFNFHLEFYELLQQENPQLLDAIKMHNESFAELYLRLHSRLHQGLSVREAIWPMAKRMALSGTSAGYGDYASDEGSSIARRVVDYYYALPDTFREEVGACCVGGNAHLSVLGIVQRIEKSDCIEAAAMDLQAVLDNPQNAVILDRSPFLSQEEKEALDVPYRGFKTGEPIIGVVGLPKTISLPESISVNFYQQIELESMDDLLTILIALPISEYQTFLSLANFVDIEFLTDLEYLLTALGAAQRAAFISALMEPEIWKCLFSSSSGHTAALVNSKDPLAITQLTAHLTPSELLEVLDERDENNRIPLHYLGFSSQGMKLLIELYPKNAKIRRKALSAVDEYGQSIWHLAALNVESLTLLIDYYLRYTKGLDPLVRAILRKDRDGCTSVHYAVGNVNALKILVAWLLEGVDEESIEEITIDFLETTDNDGNNVFHHAAVNKESLIYLLNYYSEPASIIDMLCTKNNYNESVLILHEENLPIIKAVILLLISKQVSDDVLIKFLCHPSIDETATLIGFLSANEAGNAILDELLIQRPRLLSYLRPTRAGVNVGCRTPHFFAQEPAGPSFVSTPPSEEHLGLDSAREQHINHDVRDGVNTVFRNS